jgi:hypothetical protein
MNGCKSAVDHLMLTAANEGKDGQVRICEWHPLFWWGDRV